MQEEEEGQILIQEISTYEGEERKGFRIKALLSEICGGENCRSVRLRLFVPGEAQRKLG